MLEIKIVITIVNTYNNVLKIKSLVFIFIICNIVFDINRLMVF